MRKCERVVATWALGLAVLLGSFTASLAQSPKQTTPTVYCQCQCQGVNNPNERETKTWVWSGTRDGCKQYNGGNCRNSKSGRIGLLDSCDVIVQHAAPPGGTVTPPATPPGQFQQPPTAPPSGGVKPPVPGQTPAKQ